MANSMLCQVTFSIEVETNQDEYVKVVGSIKELGNWEASDGLELVTNDIDYPYWSNETPLLLKKGTKFEFKCVILSRVDPNYMKWEELPENSNRKYKAKYMKVLLKGNEGKAEGKERIEKNFDSDVLLTENKLVRKQKNSGVFDPFTYAGKSDSESSASDFTGEPMRDSIHLDSSLDLTKKLENLRKFSTPGGVIEEEAGKSSPPKSRHDRKPVRQMTEEIHDVSSQHALQKNSESISNFYKEIVLDSARRNLGNKSSRKLIDLDLRDSVWNFECNPGDSIAMMTLDLPIIIKINKDKDSDNRFQFSDDYKIEANYSSSRSANLNQLYQLMKQKYQNMIWFGISTLPISSQSEKERLREYLLKKYSIFPIYMEQENFDTLKNIFKSCLVEYGDHKKLVTFKDIKNSEENFESIKTSSEYFFNQARTMIKENTLCFLGDFQLNFLLQYFRRGFERVQLAMYFNTKFPSENDIKVGNIQKIFLENLLCSSVITFDHYIHARDFFSALLNTYGINYKSDRGQLLFTYKKRVIVVRIAMMSVDHNNLENLKKNITFWNFFKEFDNEFQDYNLIIGVDSPDRRNGLLLKLTLFSKYLKELRDKDDFYRLKMLQIIRVESKEINNDEKSYLVELNEKCRLINEEFAEENDWAVKVILEEDYTRILSFMSVAKIFLCTPTENDLSLESLEFILCNQNCGMVLISEMAGYNRDCLSILTFNPYSQQEFNQKMTFILESRDQIISHLLTNDINNIRKNNSLIWLEGIFSDLKKTRIQTMQYFPKLEREPSLEICTEYTAEIQLSQFKADYRRSTNRMIVLDYKGTLFPMSTENICKACLADGIISLEPSASMKGLIKKMAQSKKNTAFILTGTEREYIKHLSLEIPELGVGCEYGVLYKMNGNPNWSSMVEIDWSWKEVVRRTMQTFADRTEGSSIQNKETSVVWKYTATHGEFARNQANELTQHLKNILEHIKEIEVVVGNYYVEVKPIAVNKGSFCEILLKKINKQKGEIDFILAAGDGESDEAMFSALNSQRDKLAKYLKADCSIYTIAIGKNNSKALYSIESPDELEKLLKNVLN